MVRLLFGVLVFAAATFAAEPDSSRMYLKYNYLTSPRYSLDSLRYQGTRSEFSFRSFSPSFKEAYSRRFGSKPLEVAENRHMWANIVGIPAGAVLGIGLGQLMFSKDESVSDVGAILCLVSAPLVALSISFDITSFRTIKNGMKIGN